MSRDGSTKESVGNIKAATFNSGSEPSYLDLKNVFTETQTPYCDLIKFTLPNAKAGSVIEVQYTLSSPYIYNFRDWTFQSNIPKIYSEYWAEIPAILTYHITFSGFQKLSEGRKEIEKNCLVLNGGTSDCALLKFGMKDIPAFREEKFMTAKKNFLSAVHFSLSAVHDFDGSTKNLSQKWDEVADQLRSDKDFGVQIKRGESLFTKVLDTLVSAGDDRVLKAKKIFAFIRKWYKWDGYKGFLCKTGIKKAFEAHTGNIADINLSLVAALRAGGLNAYPVLVSTRDNGVPNLYYPVVSDFNYVLARLEIDNTYYLLDASSPELPFGLFPIACIGDFAEIIYDDKAPENMSVAAPVTMQAMRYANLTLDDKGRMTGTIAANYSGYYALAKRREINSFPSHEGYLDKLNNDWKGVDILRDSISNLDDPDLPLEETMTVRLSATNDSNFNKIAVNPFFQSFVPKNPFQATERHYPIDFGTTEKLYTVFRLQYPEGYHVSAAPQKSIFSLEDNGGMYVLDQQNIGNSIIVKTVLNQAKTVYGEDDYPVLKAFYGRIIQTERTAVILSKD